MCCKIRLIRKLLIIIFLMMTDISHAQFYDLFSPGSKWEYFKNIDKKKNIGLRTRIDWNYIIFDGNVTAQKYKERILKYDKSGKLAEIENYSPEGKTLSITIFNYQADGLPLEETTYNPEGPVIEKVNYRYSHDELLNEYTSYNANRLINFKWVALRDSVAGKIVWMKYLTPDSISQKYNYIYSEGLKGLLISETLYLADTLNYNRRIYWSSDPVRKDQEIFSDAKGKELFRRKYIYDHTGNNIRVETIFPDQTTSNKFIYAYNSNKMLTGFIDHDNNGNIISYHTYTYEYY
jgi:hypothetical protein